MNNLCKLVAASAFVTGVAAPVFAQDSFEVMSASCTEYMGTAAGSREDLVKELQTVARANSMIYLLNPDQVMTLIEESCTMSPDGTVLDALIANMM